MKIVICDDSIEDLFEIEKLLLKYKELNPNLILEMEKYSDALELYRKIMRKEMAEIYILDIVMSEKTGLDLGSQIRKSGNENAIIYITSSDEYALDAYDVHAIRYLLKPVRKGQLFEALDYAISYSETKISPLYLVKTKNGLVSVPYSKIEYIENASRMLDIHLSDKTVVKSIFIRKSFDEEINQIAEENGFMQVHKSFLVNFKYVRNLSKNELAMESGAKIPVSRKKAAEVKRKYLEFVSKQY